MNLTCQGEMGEVIRHKLEAFSFGFFVPIFFVITGMKFNLTTLIETGRLRPENAAALVSAGLLSVLIFPLLALVLRGQPDPVPAAKTSHVG